MIFHHFSNPGTEFLTIRLLIHQKGSPNEVLRVKDRRRRDIRVDKGVNVIIRTDDNELLVTIKARFNNVPCFVWRLPFVGVRIRRKISPEVGIIIRVGADNRAVEDLVGVFSKNHPSERVTNMFRDTNNVSNAFSSLRGKGAFHMLVVYLLPEVETKKGADVNSDTKQDSKRNLLEGIIIEVVVKQAYIAQAQEPCHGRSTSMIHDPVVSSFDSLVAPPSSCW